MVCYHFALPGFGGGFIGVDLFFVISGLLMTGIITRALERGQPPAFIVRFYLARAVRIVPALAVVCSALLVAGWFVLPKDEYLRLGQHIVASLGFFSNMTYWREAGYFDAASHDKWLLHTWSLSVEWQFYLVLPLALWLVWKVRPGRRALAAFIAVALAASFALSVAFTPTKPTSAFFLLPSRCWEMFAGGLVFLAADRFGTLGLRARRLVEWVGIGLVVGSIAGFSSTSPWPGWRAGVPVVGTMLVLVAARSDSWLTGSRIAQWLGTCSYSIYLWHWPIVATLAYFDLHHEPSMLVLGLFATLVLGRVSYRLVEHRAKRAMTRIPPARQLRFVGGAFASVVAVTFLFTAPQLAPLRSIAPDGTFDRDLVMPLSSNGWCFRNVETYGDVPLDERRVACLLGDRSSPVTGLLFGDSFAGQYEPFWDRVGRDAAVKVESVTTNWCYPSLDDQFLGSVDGRGFQQCLIDRRHLREHLGRYDFVVFAGIWGVVAAQKKLDGLFDAIALASTTNRLVVVMADPVTFDSDVRTQYQRRVVVGLPFDIRRFTKAADRATVESNRLVEAYCRRFPNVVFLERDALFQVDGRPSDVSRDNVPFSLDGGHISVYGAKQAAEAFLSTPLYADLKPRLAALSSTDRTGRSIANDTAGNDAPR